MIWRGALGHPARSRPPAGLCAASEPHTTREQSMIVEHILSAKGHDVVTVAPDQTLLDVAQLLDEKRIGAVVVSDAAHPVLGIISERDIARALAERGAAALDELVSQHMTAKLFTCTRSSTTSDLMELMTERRVRHVPVVERGRL